MSGPWSMPNGAETLAIASGAAVSAAFPVFDYCRGAVQIPAAFTGATIQFEGTIDGVVYDVIRNDDVTAAAMAGIAVAADKIIPLPRKAFSYLKVRVKSSSNEDADRTLKYFLSGPAAS